MAIYLSSSKKPLVAATLGALEALEAANVTPAELIAQHQVHSLSVPFNNSTQYRLPSIGEKVVVMYDKGQTVIMLPDEY